MGNVCDNYMGNVCDNYRGNVCNNYMGNVYHHTYCACKNFWHTNIHAHTHTHTHKYTHTHTQTHTHTHNHTALSLLCRPQQRSRVTPTRCSRLQAPEWVSSSRSSWQRPRCRLLRSAPSPRYVFVCAHVRACVCVCKRDCVACVCVLCATRCYIQGPCMCVFCVCVCIV